MHKLSKKRVIIIALLLLSLVGGYVGWYYLLRKGPSATYKDPATHFKYGSIGQKSGFPLDLWLVIPEVFKDKLPGKSGGWEKFGFIVEEP
ncbi:MAG: hypothetical protein CMO80_17960 [Verrucomicrobiales bacterium]|nr:hypothetical protein [Verrucomicrobiales bacterium]